MNGKISKLLKNKKFKFGSVSLAFTAMVIVIILLLNYVLTIFDAKNGFYIDTTGEQRYEIGEITTQSLADIEEKIEIIFFEDKDILSGNEVMGMITTLAEKYETTFQNISVKFLDLKRDLKEIKALSELSGGEVPTETDVVVYATGSERARLMKYASFFVVDDSGYFVGFDGERRFTESILMTVKASDDKVVFVSGHKENTNPTALKEVLIGAGYLESQIIEVDLSKQEIPENTRLIIINDPALDFHGYESSLKGNVNEISKLDNYLKTNYSNLFVSIDRETKNLPALKNYLENEWGITYLEGSSVEDKQNSAAAESDRIKPDFYSSSEDGAYAQVLVKSLDAHTVVMGSCVPLAATGKQNGKVVAPVLTTSESASVISGKKTTAAKNVPLMMISTLIDYPKDENGVQSFDPSYSHVIVSGSTDFVHSDLDATNSNEDLIRNLLKMVGTRSVSTEIEPKLFADTKIVTMTNADAKKITLVLTFVPALIVALVGVAVYVRRKSL